jgi:hypothetical protein
VASRSLATMLVVRFLLVPNGVVVAALVWFAAGCLFGCVPLTDPYRAERRADGSG